MLMALAEPRCGGDSDDCVPPGGTSSSRSRWLATAVHYSTGPRVELQQRHAAPRGQTNGTRVKVETEHEPNLAVRGQKPPSPQVVVPSLQFPRLEQGEDAIAAKALAFLVPRSLLELEEENREAMMAEEDVANEEEVMETDEARMNCCEGEVASCGAAHSAPKSSSSAASNVPVFGPERRVRRQDIVDELFVLGGLPLSERTPSMERRMAELAAAIDSCESSKPPKRRKRKKRRRRTTTRRTCSCRRFWRRLLRRCSSSPY